MKLTLTIDTKKATKPVAVDPGIVIAQALARMIFHLLPQSGGSRALQSSGNDRRTGLSWSYDLEEDGDQHLAKKPVRSPRGKRNHHEP